MFNLQSMNSYLWWSPIFAISSHRKIFQSYCFLQCAAMTEKLNKLKDGQVLISKEEKNKVS